MDRRDPMGYRGRDDSLDDGGGVMSQVEWIYDRKG